MRPFLQARLFPAILTSVPHWLLLNLIFSYFKDYILVANFILPGALLYVAFLYQLVHLNRILSVIYQDFLFGGEMFMCTVSSLLWSDSKIAITMKADIHLKVKEVFDIDLLTQEQESMNEIEARKKLVYAVKKITYYLSENKLRKQYGLEYAFIRNFIGGCLSAIMVLLVILFYSIINSSLWLTDFSMVLWVFYMLPILLSKYIIKWFGVRYAKILLEQFICETSKENIISVSG